MANEPTSYCECDLRHRRWNRRTGQCETCGGTWANATLRDRRSAELADAQQRRAARQREGAALIAAERERQRSVEGWSAEHDSEHAHGELAIAAACYALNGTDADVAYPDAASDPPVPGWPWHSKWWKPKGQIRDLVRAGALIAAEIDRLTTTGEGGQNAP